MAVLKFENERQKKLFFCFLSITTYGDGYLENYLGKGFGEGALEKVAYWEKTVS